MNHTIWDPQKTLDIAFESPVSPVLGSASANTLQTQEALVSSLGLIAFLSSGLKTIPFFLINSINLLEKMGFKVWIYWNNNEIIMKLSKNKWVRHLCNIHGHIKEPFKYVLGFI